ncbi:MAG: pyruvate kinase, partial [Gemmatimonadota bacterium]
MLRTKMVCTLGPASGSAEVLRGLVDGGLHMARINMSHGRPEDHRRTIETVRRVAAEAGRPVAILVDLAGPKIRVGELRSPKELSRDARVVMAPEGTEQEDEIPTTYAPLASEIEPGDRVLLDDGLMELECVGTRGDRTLLRVVRGGILESRKGINLPGVRIQAPSLTPKDAADLDFALDVEA